MKSLQDNDGCKYALTTSEKPSQDPLFKTLGASYPHLFCGEPTIGDGVYCAEHHKLCRRGPGKDARSLEEMIYAVDHSQYRGKPPYADHTDPIDEEVRRELIRDEGRGEELRQRRARGAGATSLTGGGLTGHWINNRRKSKETA